MKNKTSGFTLIELMIAVSVAGIGIFAVSWVLLLNQNSWKEGNAKLQLQRDAYVAMLKIEHELRPARSSEISTYDPTYDSALVIDSNGKEFFLQSDDLKFQESSSDDSTIVVEGDNGTDIEFDITSNDVVNITM